MCEHTLGSKKIGTINLSTLTFKCAERRHRRQVIFDINLLNKKSQRPLIVLRSD